MTIKTIIESFELNLKACVREVVGKRKVFCGSWKDQEVFVKVFFDSESAERHWSRDLKGIQKFQEASILTPKLLWHGKLPVLPELGEKSCHALIIKAVPDAESFKEIWENSSEREVLAKKIISVLAQHHKAGLIQTDLHFGNFLVSGDNIYSLDGDAIKAFGDRPPLAKTAESFSLLTAQADVSDEHLFINSIPEYCSLTGCKEDEFSKQVRNTLMPIRKRRCHKLMKKIYRECTAVKTFQSKGKRAFVNSKFDSADIWRCIENPDSFFPIDSSLLLKNGNSASVALATLNGQKVVIKRYNYKKNMKTFIRRFRKSRASISWSNAFRLLNYGIRTPEPIALIETCNGPAMKNAYFISEFIEGEDLLSYSKNPDNKSDISDIAEQVKVIFDVWGKCSISHGDCKATNFIYSDGRVYVIDLDSMKEHASKTSFNKRRRKDINRWEKNWEDTPSIAQCFKLKFQL